jgi:RND superfamily putative drug exporter
LLARLADLGVRAPRRVLGLAAALLVLAAIFGSGAAAHLSSGGFADPSAPSSAAATLLTDTFDAGPPNIVLEVTAAGGADSAQARARGLELVQRLEAAPYTAQVSSYWTAPAGQAAALRSADGRAGLVLARVSGDDSQAPARAGRAIAGLTGTADGVTVRAGGAAVTFDQVNEAVKNDLQVAEAVAVPLTVLALIWVFGSLYAALLPLVIGLSSIVGTLAILRVLAALTDVSVYAMNMTTAMGLALGIDYSLFIVSRFREELRSSPAVRAGAAHAAAGGAVHTAVLRTMQTAGRTVLFSALTVALSLAAMLVFPLYFLRSFAYAGIAVVALATVAALVLLPALLVLLGPRVDALDLRRAVRRALRRPPPRSVPLEQSFWYRFASAVMRRAVPVAVLATALLVALGLPFLHVKFGYPDDRILPHSASAHHVGDDLRNRFGSNVTAQVIVAVPSVAGAPDAIAGYASALSRIEHVGTVSSPVGAFAGGRRIGPGNPAMSRGSAAYLTVQTDVDPLSAAGGRTLRAVERAPAPWPVLAGGAAAVNQDSLDSLGAAMPYAIGLIALATFVVLFLFTGSVLLPIKALVLNTLSLSAMFGAMVWIFQDGHLAWLFRDLTTIGHITPTMPPLMFCVAFGLSMDYEVFLLSRIREQWLATGDNARAVATGLAHTGRIVTAAALLMAIVFAAMAGASVSFMMMFGAGMTLAVVMDATVVRATLVPAFMRLAGRWNWWAPRPLARLHARIGLSE